MRRPVEILATLAMAAFTLWTTSAAAQDLDTTAVAVPDTVTADTLTPALSADELRRMELRRAPSTSIDFYRDDRGAAVGRREPARAPVLHPVEYVHDLLGAFSWAFRTTGWPDAWCHYGLDQSSYHFTRHGTV